MKDTKKENSENNCQNSSCSCSENKNKTMQDLTAVSSQEVKEEIKELDPTHFGDWQVKGRAIDF